MFRIVHSRRRVLLGSTSILAALVACVDKQPATPPDATAAAEDKTLNLYLWSSQSAGSSAAGNGLKQPSVGDFLAADTISNFEKATGIKVSVTNYASDEELQAK